MEWMKRKKESDNDQDELKNLEKRNSILSHNCIVLENCNNKQAEMLEELHKEIKSLKETDGKKSIELDQLKEEKEKLLNKISWLENENDRLAAKALRWDLSNL